MFCDTNGILVIDKPADISSAQVVAKVKRLFDVRKAGHAGTLDPMATGILICCLNDATRLARFFLGGGKRYQAVLSLGIETDTQDATGNITATGELLGIAPKEIEAATNRFVGTILQQPPAFSALKHKGVPLYKLARKGKPVQKPARPVTINQLCIDRIQLPDIAFTVSCSAGTYIRTLCADIGKDLGCGGHLKALRRVESGGFTLEDAIRLPDLESLHQKGVHGERLFNMSRALRKMPVCQADAALAEQIRNGIRLEKDDIAFTGDAHPDGCIQIIDGNDALVAVIQKSSTEHHYRYCCVFRKP